MQNGKEGTGNKNRSKQKRASLTSQQSQPVTNHPNMEQRKESVAEYLARGGEYTVVEGEDNYPRIILIKFPSYEKALEWYHSEDYKPIKDIRLQNSEGLNIIVKGI